MSLFKYTNLEVAEFIIQRKKIRITQAIAFNDPYDVYPKLNNLIPDHTIEGFISKIISDETLFSEIFDEAIAKEYPKLSPELKFMFSIIPVKKWFMDEAVKKHGSVSKAFKDKIDYESINQKIVNLFLALISTHVGILSLSKINNDLLKWSHYSDAHQGVVFEFDEAHPFLRQFENPNFSSIIDINYSDERPEIIFDRFDLTIEESIEMAKKIFFTKARVWSYEQEFRLIKLLSGKEKLEKSDKNGFDIFVADIPLECLKSVIFGSRMKQQNIDQFISLVNENNFDPITFHQAYLDSDKFLIRVSNL